MKIDIFNKDYYVLNNVVYYQDGDAIVTAPCNMENGRYLNGVKLDNNIVGNPYIIDALNNAIVIDRATIKAKDLLTYLKYVKPAIGKDKTRYYLNGIAFHEGNIVATNGHVLRMMNNVINLKHDDYKQGIIVPREAVDMLVKLLSKFKSETIKIDVFKEYMVFRISDHTVTCKIIDGTYPLYEQVIPKDFKHSFSWRKEYLKDVKVNLIKKLMKDGCLFIISDKMRFVKDDEIKIEIDKAISLPIDVGVNPLYLKDIPNGVCYITDAISPLRFEHNINGKSATSAVMPMIIK